MTITKADLRREQMAHVATRASLERVTAERDAARDDGITAAQAAKSAAKHAADEMRSLKSELTAARAETKAERDRADTAMAKMEAARAEAQSLASSLKDAETRSTSEIRGLNAQLLSASAEAKTERERADKLGAKLNAARAEVQFQLTRADASDAELTKIRVQYAEALRKISDLESKPVEVKKARRTRKPKPKEITRLVNVPCREQAARIAFLEAEIDRMKREAVRK